MNTRSIRIGILLFALSSITVLSDLSAQIWQRSNLTHRSTQIIPGGGRVVFSIQDRLFRSADHGTTFTVIFPEAGVTGFSIGSTGMHYVSSAQGLSSTKDPVDSEWVKLTAADFPAITCLYVRASPDSPGEDEIFLGSAKGLWSRKSSSQAWQKKHDARDEAPILQVTAFNKNIYYRTSSSAYASHDGGETWKNITQTTFGKITAILTTSENDVYLAVSGNPSSNVLHSTMGGDDKFDGFRGINFSARTIQSLIVDGQGNLYLGGGVRDEFHLDSIKQAFVYRFPIGSFGWEDYSSGLPSSPPASEVITMGIGSTGKVYASTDSAGLWRTVLPNKVNAHADQNGIILSQNFPNPVTTTTEFSVSNNHTITGSIGVFDALGRKIIDLSNGALIPGTHFFTIDTKSFATGTYFYKIQTAESSETRSFVVSK